MKKLLGVLAILSYTWAWGAFTPPESNSTVMVDNGNVLVAPNATTFITANFSSIAPQSNAGLLGSSFNGASSVSDWRIDSAWMDTNYAKNLTASTGLLLDSGTTYNGKAARTITVDRAYIEQVIRETAFVVESYQILIDTSPSLDLNNPSIVSFINRQNPFYYKEGSSIKKTLNSSGQALDYYTQSIYRPNIILWTDAEFKILDAYGNLIYWVSTQWGAQMGTDYTTHPAADLNAKIFYTCADTEYNREGSGREWIEYIHNDVNARTIYEHAQNYARFSDPTIGGIIIQPNMSGTTVGGTPIKDIFGTIQENTPNSYSCVFLKCSPLNYERNANNFPMWRPYNVLSTAIQKAR